MHHTCIVRCNCFSVELWLAASCHTHIDTGMTHAAGAVAACASPAAYTRKRSICAEVLWSNLGILLAWDMRRLAHARHLVEAHWADARAQLDRINSQQRTHSLQC